MHLRIEIWKTIRLPETLVSRRPSPVVSEEKKIVTLGSLRNLGSGSAKRKTFEFFHFLEALEDCKCR